MVLSFPSGNRQACGGSGGVGPDADSKFGTAGVALELQLPSPRESTLSQDFRDALQILFRIDTNGVVRRLADVYGSSVFEETQLFQPLGFFQSRFGPAHKKIERSFPVSVEAKVLEVGRAGVVTVEGDRCPGKIESVAVRSGHDFDCVGITNFFRWARSLHGSHLNCRV